MNAAELDLLAFGLRVFRYARPDGTEYETRYDFSRFGIAKISERRITDPDEARAFLGSDK